MNENDTETEPYMTLYGTFYPIYTANTNKNETRRKPEKYPSHFTLFDKLIIST